MYSIKMPRVTRSSYTTGRIPLFLRRKTLIRLHTGHLGAVAYSNTVSPISAKNTTSHTTISHHIERHFFLGSVSISGPEALDAQTPSKSSQMIQYRPPQRSQTYSVELRRKTSSSSYTSRRFPVLFRRNPLIRLHDGQIIGPMFINTVNPTHAIITVSHRTTYPIEIPSQDE